MISLKLVIAIVLTLTIPTGFLYANFKDDGLPPLGADGCGPKSDLAPIPAYVDTTSFFKFPNTLQQSLNAIIKEKTVGTRLEIWANIHQLNGAGPTLLHSFCIPPKTRKDAVRLGVEAGGDDFYSEAAKVVESKVKDKISALVELIEKRATAWNSPLLESLVYFLHRDYQELVLLSDSFHLTQSRQFCETKGHLRLRGRTQLLVRESLDPALTAGKRLHWLQVVVPGRQASKPHCVEEEATRWWLNHFELAKLSVRHNPEVVTRKPEPTQGAGL